MDMTTKGASWVGNMCKKLQTMCIDALQEMDLIAEEHMKYMKGQEEATGANVRNFNSEVLQDMFPDVAVAKDPPSDSSLICASDDGLPKERVEDLSPNNAGGCRAEEGEDYLGHCGNVICPVNPIKAENTKEEGVRDDQKYNLENNNSPSTTIDTEENGLVGAKDYQVHGLSDDNYPASSISAEVGQGADDKSFPTPINGEEIRTERVEFSQRPASVEATSSSEPETTHSSYSTTGSCTLGDATSSGTSAGMVTSLLVAQSGVSDGIHSVDSFQSIDKVAQRVEEIEEFEDVFLGESYLDAGEEELDREISIVCQQVAMRKSKSYKKKFQDALLSKLVSTKMHNSVNLAVLYGNTLENNTEDFRSSVADQMGSKKLLDPCFFEPGWEFL